MNNWEAIGLKSIDDAYNYIIDFLFQNKDSITSRSINGQAVFWLRDKMITLSGKKPKEDHSIEAYVQNWKKRQGVGAS